MAKVPSFSPIRYNHQKKLERLYFPQYGDSGLYLECGKKHYKPEAAFKPPYASYEHNDQYLERLRSKFLPQSSSPSKTQHQRYKKEDKHLDLVSHRGNYDYRETLQKQMRVERDVLDEQINKFKVTKKEQRSQPFEETKRTYRFKTQNQGSNYQQQHFNLPATLQQNDDKVVKDRVKTQQTYKSTPTSINGNMMRFNPTFLSSINY